MIRIGEQPILWHIMKTYAHYGIHEFVICLGYKGWMIKEFFLNYHAMMSDLEITLGKQPSLEILDANYSEHDWKITLAETGYDTQTGGRIKKVRKYVEDSDLFCITYGDGVTNLDLSKVLDFHRRHGRVGTVTGVRPPGRFGVLEVDEKDPIPVVQRFYEKPQASEGLINGGYFIFDQRLWNYLNDDTGLIFEQQPLMDLARDGELVMYEHNGFWQPMDTYREWKLLNELWAANQAPWKCW